MKQMKVLGVIAMALTLGLTACGGPNQKTCKHKWGDWEVVTAETCTTDGLQKRTCTVCKLVEEKKINKGHKWGSWETVTASTCTVQGDAKRTCSRCNEVETKKLDLAPHTPKVDAEGNEIIEWETEPTCEAAGVGGHRTCSVCQTAIPVSSSEAAALGHNFHKDAEGKIEFTWTTAPSCTLPGVGTKHCDRCGQDIAATDEERKALGHDTELIGGAEEAPAGEATVRVYRCKRCNDEFLGFKADEPSADSLPHLTVGDNQGMRFFGRPIGNSLALTSNGTSVNQQNNECVYCSTETGDFFEYIFTLNATQAEKLSTCRLYCDARPADHLAENGGDFWAYGRSSTDWTPGYYIDGSDAHIQHNDDGTPKMGKDHARAVTNDDGSQAEGVELDTEVALGARIEDYRYILYVDGNPVDFDEDTKVPVEGSSTNMVRKEYILPYTFHLHAGQNKISLRMAGGYRSEFYNFIFRPYVEPTPVTVTNTELEVREGETVQIESTMTGLQYASSSNSIATVDANGLVTGVKAGKATITVSKDGNYKPAKVEVTVKEKAGTINLNLTDGVIAPADGLQVYESSSSGTWYRNWKTGTTVTYTFQSELAGKFDIKLGLRGSNIVLADNFSIKVNNAPVTLAGTVNTSYSAVEYTVGQADLIKGANTMVITALADVDLYFKTLQLAPASAAPAHEHTWGNPVDVAANTERGTVAYKKYTCSGCDKVKIEIAITESMKISGSWATSPGNSTGYYKLGGNGDTFGFKFDYDANAAAVAYQRGICETSNGNRTYFDVKNASNTNGNFELKVNNNAIDLTPMKNVKYSEMLGSAEGTVKSGFTAPADAKIGDTNLINGVNEVVYKRIDSYNFGISHIFFIVG